MRFTRLIATLYFLSMGVTVWAQAPVTLKPLDAQETQEQKLRRLIVVKKKNHNDTEFAAFMLQAMWEKANSADKTLAKRNWVLAFHDKAKDGDTDAGYFYGAARLVGFGIPEGPEREIYGYVSAAAEKNKPEALRDLAVLTFLGFGVKQDNAAAFALAKRAADAKLPSGQALVAEFYQAGVGVDKSNAAATMFFGAAAAGGDPIGEYNLALIVRKSDPVRALKLATESANSGYGPAMVLLGGDLVYGGEGITQNEAAGFEWLAAAAALGEPTAQELCGVFYLNGSHTAKQSDLAGRIYLETAADNGDDDAQYNLGMLLLAGEHGAAKDEKAGLELITKSAKQGNTDALKELRSRL